MHRKILIAAGAALVFGLAVAACETVVDVALPPHEAKLVVSGFFSSDSLWLVRVTRSEAYTSRNRLSPVGDAAVEVRSSDGGVLNLAHRDSGLYAGTGLRPDPEKPYTVRVDAEGFDRAEGSDRLPDPPAAGSFTASSEVSASRSRTVAMRLTIDDPAGAANYYGLFVVQSRWRIGVAKGTVQPLLPTLFSFESSDPIFNEESVLDFLGEERRLYRDPFFDDMAFDGTQREVELQIRFQEPDVTADRQIWRAFALVVVSVSENLFRYWTSANEQLTTGQNPFAEPIRVHSNIEGGLGIFAGFRHRTFPIPPQHSGLTAACEAYAQLRAACDSLNVLMSGIGLSPVRSRLVDGPITR